MYSRIEKKIQYKGKLVFIFLSILILASINNIKVDMAKNYYSNSILFLPLSSIGIYIIFYLSIKIKKNIILKNIFLFLGKNTLTILALHMICFKMITFLEIIYYNESLKLLTTIPTIYLNGIWWVEYSIVGVLFPLLINKLFVNLKDLLFASKL